MRTPPAILLALALIAPLAGGCSSGKQASVQDAATSATTASAPGTLGEAEVRYGAAPTRTSEVEYQPDVIIPGGGAQAIRSVSADGLTWNIDANAPGAADLVAGKIMFLTGRSVGRVLHLARKGDELGVTVGPVELTDVIKQAHLSGNQTFDPGTMHTYSAPEWPGAEADPISATAGLAPPAPLAHFASFERAPAADAPVQIAQVPIPLPAIGPPKEITTSNFSFNPFLGGGLGANFSLPVKNAAIAPVSVQGSVMLNLSKPFVSYDINITPRGLETAKFELHNAAGLTVRFEARTSDSFKPGDNVQKLVFLPMDLSLPLGGPVPLAFTLHQEFMLNTAFTARQATLSANGEYTFDGSLKVECHYSSCHATGPTGFAMKQSLMDSISGASLGVNALIITYEGRAIVGLGAFGFVTGPYVGFGTSVGVTRGSDADPLQRCKQVNMALWIRAGVGYAMPPSVVKALNFILSVFNVAPIKSVGGPGVVANIIEPRGQRVGCGPG